jgi:SAM-dependent methyltransferase
MEGNVISTTPKESNDVSFTPKAWSNSRRDLIVSFLRRFSASSPLLDVGCGPGEPWPGFDTFGLDVNPEAVESAKMQGINAVIGDACRIPYDNEKFYTVLMLDVLEHIDNQSLALREVKRVLKNNGLLILSVPLYPFFWSYHDVQVGHVRRYTPRELARYLKQEGVQILYRTCWNILGLPGAALRKFGLKIDKASELARPVLKLESSCASRLPLPFGLSEFWVAKKI